MILPGRPYRVEAIFHTSESNDLIVDDGVLGIDGMLFASHATSGAMQASPFVSMTFVPGVSRSSHHLITLNNWYRNPMPQHPFDQL